MNESKTPRTDSAQFLRDFGGTHKVVMCEPDFARQLERELNQWKECADRLVAALNDVNDHNEGMLVWDDKVGSALAHYNQLKQGEGK